MEATAGKRRERTVPGGDSPSFGPGFRRWVLVSLVVHGLLLGAIAWQFLTRPVPPPPPAPLATAFEAEWVLEPDPEMVLLPPADPDRRETSVLLETVDAEFDPRLDDPAAPRPALDDGSLGVGTLGTRRAPRPVARPGSGVDGGAGPPAPPTRAVPPPSLPVHRDARPDPALCAPPRYPRWEEQRGVTGVVRLRVSVSADGTVADLEVETPSGHESLDAAAAAAVREWTFLPATEDGVPVESVVLQPVAFRPRR